MVLALVGKGVAGVAGVVGEVHEVVLGILSGVWYPPGGAVDDIRGGLIHGSGLAAVLGHTSLWTALGCEHFSSAAVAGLAHLLKPWKIPTDLIACAYHKDGLT